LRRLHGLAASSVTARIAIAARLLGLGIAAVLSAATAGAQERLLPPVFAVEGSLPVTYTDNADRNALKQSDSSFSPYLKLSLSGTLPADFRASVYASAGYDRYTRLRDDDGAFAAVGGSVSRRWGHFSAGVSYEHAFNYERFFAQPINTPNDFDVFLRYRHRPSDHLRITPRISYGTRLGDAWSLERHTWNLKVDVEQRIVGRWWLVMTPRLRHYTFYGEDEGRRDLILSLSGGVRYEFNDDVSFTSAIGYEARGSNFADKKYDAFTAGMSLDFSYTFDRLRWPRILNGDRS